MAARLAGNNLGEWDSLEIQAPRILGMWSGIGWQLGGWMAFGGGTDLR